MKYKNSLKKGVVRFIIFKENDTWYGVALEFNIVEEGDNPQLVMFSLFEAIRGYVKTAQTYKLRPMTLNQITDKEYEEMWRKLKEREECSKEKTLSPIDNKEIFTFGCQPLNTAMAGV